MIEGRARKFGDMNIRHKFISRLIHGQVSIYAQAKQTDGNRTVGCQPPRNSFAFFFRVDSVAFESNEALAADGERCQKFF